MNNNELININIPGQVKKILGILNDAGHEAYVVGGCVRDSILGRTPGDWDITTSALPHEVKSLFYNTVDTGIQHGTVMVLMGGSGYEITTYRRDGKYSDCRRPDEVEFTPSLEEDLKRRDFTINAMAYNYESGIIDIFGGLDDIKNRIIRCVGDPYQRFSEDALRIMRAVRFAAQLSFEIEPETYGAICRHAENLSRISMERIRVEFEKTLMSDNPGYVNRFRELGLDPYIIRTSISKGAPDKRSGSSITFSEQEKTNNRFSVKEHAGLNYSWNEVELSEKWEAETECPAYRDCFTDFSVKKYNQFQEGRTNCCIDLAENGLSVNDVRSLRLAAFFEELSPEDAAAALKDLTYDNKTKSTVKKILQYKDRNIPPDRRFIKRALCEMGSEILRLVWEYKSAVMHADSTIKIGEMRCFEMRDEDMLNDAVELTEDILEKGEPYNLKMLDINGNDLIAAGISQGEEVRIVLERLLEEVICDPSLNNKETLIKMIDRS